MSDENDAPCGCCRRIDGYWIANCGCDNGGDLEEAVAWCGDQNRGAEVVALRAEIERLIGLQKQINRDNWPSKKD
jgi:hypothetical protein